MTGSLGGHFIFFPKINYQSIFLTDRGYRVTKGIVGRHSNDNKINTISTISYKSKVKFKVIIKLIL